MYPTITDWEITFVESEEGMLCAIAAFIHQMAVQLQSLSKMPCDFSREEVEQQIISRLALLQVIHINVLQRKWLLSEMCMQEECELRKDHEGMVDSIQELEQAISLHRFTLRCSSKKIRTILKQISAHYYSAVRIIIVGNPSPAPPWKPRLKQKGEKI